MKTMLTQLSSKKLVHKGFYLSLLLCLATALPGFAQYCTTNLYSIGCTDDDYVQSFSTSGAVTNISNLNSDCNGGTSGYTYFTGMSASAIQGTSFTFNYTNTPQWTEGYKIWVDWNQDGTFDDLTELVYSPTSTTVAGGTGSGTISVPAGANVGLTRMRVRCYYFSTSFTACSSGIEGEIEDYDFVVIASTPCAGQPTAGTLSPASPYNACAGSTLNITTTGATSAGNLTYQWQQSTDGGITWVNAVGGSGGGTGPNYTTPVITGPIQYRYYIVCTTVGLADTSAPLVINATSPSYVTIPYSQDFENTWSSFCSTDDVPDSHWLNNPATGVTSWRRDDDGSSAGWLYPYYGTYSPAAYSGTHSARWHAYEANSGSGTLSLFLNCSTSPGTNELDFAYISTYYYYYDTITVRLSTDGGATFTTLGNYGPLASGNIQWTPVTLSFTSNSAQTVIQFVASQTGYGYYDIGIDGVSVVPGCTGAPTAGAATAPTVCAGQNFTLSLTGATVAAGINYTWQYSTDGTNYTSIPSSNSPTYTTVATATTYYRAILTCSNSALSDTSGATLVTITSAIPYTPIPYTQDFENWTNGCNTSDVPDVNWSNSPATGNESWRRDDQGSTANWASPYGSYTPASVTGSHSARWHAYDANTGSGSLSVYLNCSSSPGINKLDFSYISSYYYYYDTIKVRLSTDGGASFTTIGSYGPLASGNIQWTPVTLSFTSTSAQTIIQFVASQTGYGYYDLGIDAVSIVPGCTGTPNAGTAMNTGSCAGQSIALSLNGASLAAGLSYQWQYSPTGAAGSWTNISNSDSAVVHVTTNTSTYYQAIVTCLNSGLSDTSVPVQVVIAPPTYSPIPYTQDFENWITYCSNHDVPDVNWINSPSNGTSSWRRDDEGATAGWNYPTSGAYSPPSVTGSHSARWHSYEATAPGELSMLLDCSASPGTNKLDFSYISSYYYYYDSIKVSLSTNGGTSFTTLGTYGPLSSGSIAWTPETISFTSTSATTIIKFQGKNQGYGYYDLGIDAVSVVPGCTGTPTAGAVANNPACSGQNFMLWLTGATQAAGLTYVWQQSTNGTTWTTLAGQTSDSATGNITAPTYFRAIVTCTSSGQSDTTAGLLVDIASFYYCYCQSASTGNYTATYYAANVGNVTLETVPAAQTILNNGNATPLLGNTSATASYTSYSAALTPATLYRDSSYNVKVTDINYSTFFTNAHAAVWIDFDRNGSFDANEKITDQGVPTGNQQITAGFIVPTDAGVGLTGMRVIVNSDYGITSVSPCGTYGNGETEDYLVNIQLPPCNGPVNAGTAFISDTSSCVGYPVSLVDTTHGTQMGGLTWLWQESTNGGTSWSYIAGSVNKDTLNNVVIAGATAYRFVIVCTNSGDSSFSNVVGVTIAPPYACYCYSIAIGGANGDSSDIGAFKIGGFTVMTGGPHLGNPSATRARTDYTSYQDIILYTNQTYDINMFHTMKTYNHADAKITLFIDYNNNHAYDIPEERVYTGISTAADWYKISSITIPNTATKNVITGMRLIINNDVNPNVPSDDACGAYQSGETEDYVVTFKQGTLDVGSVTGLIGETSVYPNPNDGRFTVAMNGAKGLGTVQLTVTTVSGQSVFYQSYDAGTSSEFKTTIDLSNQAKGIYFVTLAAGSDRVIKKLVIE